MLAEPWAFYEEAVTLLDQGDLRNAAGKAWEASEKAANALILERTGREPQDHRETSEEPIIRDIHDTEVYIRDAERLAGV